MITFLMFLLGAAVLAFAVTFFSGRYLIRIYPARKLLASTGAVLLALVALAVFHLVADFLIRVKAPSAGMGGLAWALEILSYVIAAVVTIPCLIAGTVKGVKPPAASALDDHTT